ncbi:MAG: hypothetical protein ACP5OU_03535 [Methanothrix sp.]
MLPAMAYNQAEFDAFAEGVISGRSWVHVTNWTVSDDMLIVSGAAKNSDLIYNDTVVNLAEDLEETARKIADHYPGEFNATVGIITWNGTSLAVVKKYYRPDAKFSWERQTG